MNLDGSDTGSTALEISRVSTVFQLEEKIRQEFEIDSKQLLRLWAHWDETGEVVQLESSGILGEVVGQGVIIRVECQLPDGLWSRSIETEDKKIKKKDKDKEKKKDKDKEKKKDKEKNKESEKNGRENGKETNKEKRRGVLGFLQSLGKENQNGSKVIQNGSTKSNRKNPAGLCGLSNLGNTYPFLFLSFSYFL